MGTECINLAPGEHAPPPNASAGAMLLVPVTKPSRAQYFAGSPGEIGEHLIYGVLIATAHADLNGQFINLRSREINASPPPASDPLPDDAIHKAAARQVWTATALQFALRLCRRVFTRAHTATSTSNSPCRP